MAHMLPKSGVLSWHIVQILDVSNKELNKRPKYSRKEQFHYKGKYTFRCGRGTEQEKRGSKGVVSKPLGFLSLFAVVVISLQGVGFLD